MRWQERRRRTARKKSFDVKPELRETFHSSHQVDPVRDDVVVVMKYHETLGGPKLRPVSLPRVRCLSGLVEV